MMHQYLNRFDHRLSSLVASLPEGVRPFMNIATFIGEPIIVIVVALIIAIAAYVKDVKNILKIEALGLVFFGVNTLIKHTVHRARPDTIYAHSMRIKSYSFPSGHAFGSAYFYGLLTYLAFTRLPHPYNILVSTVLFLTILSIGVSRVYLGAHFPSDVLVGWIFGAVSLFISLKLFKLV